MMTDVRDFLKNNEEVKSEYYCGNG